MVSYNDVRFAWIFILCAYTFIFSGTFKSSKRKEIENLVEKICDKA